MTQLRTPIYYLLLTLAVLLCGIGYPAVAADIEGKPGTVFRLHFDKPLSEEIPKDLLVEAKGGAIIQGGVSGKALRLKQGEHLVLNLSDRITNIEGTIMLWVRPHWRYDDPASHTFLSFTWSGNDQGYFSLSKGWWEPQGEKLSYFILNNRDSAYTVKFIDYKEKGWTHLACTWKSGKPGNLRFYINGFISSENPYYASALRYPSPKIYLGSDQGSLLAKGRWADSDIDELAFSSKALSDEEIFATFKKQGPAVMESPKKIDGKTFETRVILDEGIGWATDTGARKIIARIKQAGFNVYIPCVWHGQGTRYPTTKFPPEKGFTLLPTDPLKRLIDFAHQNNIEVHPWFCVALRQKDFLPEFYGPGSPKNAFDLHRPAFRSFIVDVIVDVAKRYEIDGINLDFIRTMGICTCDFCIQEYHRTFGRNLLYDMAHPGPKGRLQPELQKWQDEAVEDIVRRVKDKIKAIKTKAIISVDGHPLSSPSPEGRQEVKWANDGLVDVIFNMDYFPTPDFENHNVVRNRLKVPSKLIMLVANYQKGKPPHLDTDPPRLVRIIENIRSRWNNGIGVYLYNLLDDNQISALSRGPFHSLARPWRKGKFAE